LKPDVIIILSLFELEGRIATSVNTVGHSIPTVVMIYDLIPFIFSKTYLGDAYIGSLYLSKIEHLKRADLCFSISDSTKEDAVTYLSINKEKIVSVWCGIDAKFAPILLSDEQIRLLKNKYSIDREFVMYTGGTDWRKNIDGLIRGFARLEKALRDKHQLVVVCSIKDEEKEKFGQLVTSLGLNQADVIFTGYVSDDELIAFYNSCKLFVFPALYEGFPLPVLEAMACGAPTVVSEQASMFEEVGRKDMTFNPKSDESIAKKMEEMLTNDALRKDIKDYGLKRVKMFSWEKTADIVFDTLEGLVQNAKGMK
jgi:glycosyltransferase involved in cell wall biosynthesis